MRRNIPGVFASKPSEAASSSVDAMAQRSEKGSV
jgi:hypothetical protein